MSSIATKAPRRLVENSGIVSNIKRSLNSRTRLKNGTILKLCVVFMIIGMTLTTWFVCSNVSSTIQENNNNANATINELRAQTADDIKEMENELEQSEIAHVEAIATKEQVIKKRETSIAQSEQDAFLVLQDAEAKYAEVQVLAPYVASLEKENAKLKDTLNRAASKGIYP